MAASFVVEEASCCVALCVLLFFLLVSKVLHTTTFYLVHCVQLSFLSPAYTIVSIYKIWGCLEWSMHWN